MAEKKDSRTAVIVAIIGLAGALCAAVIANMDKLVNIVSQRNTNNTNSAISISSSTPSTSLPPNVSTSESVQKSGAIFNNWNEDASKGNPPSPTEFPIKEPYMITKIVNYHGGWTGIPPPGAVMKLRNSAGKEFGPWRVYSGNSEHWVCSPLIEIPAGTYTVIDPDPATWSQNGASKHRGMSLVEGYAISGKTK